MALQIASFLPASGAIAATTMLSGPGPLLRAILRLLLGKGAQARSLAGVRMTTMIIIIMAASAKHLPPELVAISEPRSCPGSELDQVARPTSPSWPQAE
jgi:hypothetical protein